MCNPAKGLREVSTDLPPGFQQQTLGVAFFDLSRMTEWGSSGEDALVAKFLQRFYELSGEILAPAGARIVKFMGDAGLCVFPEETRNESR